MEHIQSKLCALVAFGGCVVKIAEVGGNARNAQNAGLLVEYIEHLVNADAVLVHYELDNACVQIAAACAHGQTDQGSEAHGGINALASVDSCYGAAVAHMAGDDLQLFDGLAHQLCAAAGNIAMRGAVEAVATDAVIFVVLIGNGVHVSLAGHGLVESGVEHCNHGNVAHNVAAGVDADDVCRVVQGSEGSALLERFHNCIVDAHGGSKLLAAVNDAVADSVDLLHGGDNAVLGAGELVDNSRNCLCVGGHCNILIKYGLAAYQGAVLKVTVEADTLAKALSHYRLGLHVDELVLQGRTACVDYKNFHSDIPFLL